MPAHAEDAETGQKQVLFINSYGYELDSMTAEIHYSAVILGDGAALDFAVRVVVITDNSVSGAGSAQQAMIPFCFHGIQYRR